MSGTLYVVGTPIGNLDDFSPRAKETLNLVDFIAAEDTRVTIKLLNRFGIKKPLISYHEHSQSNRDMQIIKKILDGKSAAIVSDAGMPCISDPGEKLVRLCKENSIEVKVIPGPTAAIAALCISGLDSSRFTFCGFLSTNRKNKLDRISELKNLKHTLIFYEAPHKLKSTLSDLLSELGNRKIAIVKELTKIHESVLTTTLLDAVNHFNQEGVSPKGEHVLVVEGASNNEDACPKQSFEETVQLAKELVLKGAKPTDAAKQAAFLTNYKKSDIYKALILKDD